MPNNTPRGLTQAEVDQRIAKGLVNDTGQQTSRSLKDILRANVFTRFNALLGVLFIIVLSVGSPADALFGLVVIINSAIGIVQELRAKRTLDKLAILHAPVAHALRDGKKQTLPVSQVVLDDMLEIATGDQIPADGIILESAGLEVDEALLTGESDPINKTKDAKVLSGSMVVAGNGFMKTTAVGKEAYAYKISSQVKKFSRTKSELVDGTNKLLGYISWIILIVAPLLVWGQIVNSGNTWQEALVRSTAAIVGMIPEGLVLLTSMAFLIATIVLARKKVLVQQLPAVEGLARVDVICLDKTGTLTEDRIIFKELILLDKKLDKRIKQVLAAFAQKPDSSTLIALNDVFTDNAVAISSNVPFSSARKWSALTQRNGDSWVLGAPEIVLANKDKIARAQADEIANSGHRVLCLLHSKEMPNKEYLPKNMKPVALIVFAEKVRDDAKETLEFFATQGVKLKIISGDNPKTVGAVARAVGVAVQSEPFDARMLPEDMQELARVMKEKDIFGRVNPDQKRAMVKALQANGHVVAMTGDGVNDALALKDADIGIAMSSGSQATKAVAELVLLDNKFSHMPRVLAEGRRVIANIERVANLFLTKNVYSLFLALVITLSALPYPFMPRHMTVLSALTIGIPAFFLALAPNNRRYIPGFLPRVLKFAIPVGSLIAILIFTSYLLIRGDGGSPELASTVASSVVMIVGVWVLLCLARPLALWKVGLVAAMVVAFAFLINFSFSQELLSYALDGKYLSLTLTLGLVGCVLVEVVWRFDQRKR